MPLVVFSAKLDRIHECLLFKAKDRSLWMSAVCTFRGGRQMHPERAFRDWREGFRSRLN